MRSIQINARLNQTTVKLHLKMKWLCNETKKGVSEVSCGFFTIFIFYTNFSFVLLIFKSFLKIFVTEKPVIRLTRLDITTITKIKIKELEKDAQKYTKNYEANGLKKHSHAWSEIIDLGSFPNFNFHLNSSNGQQISIKRI